MTNRAEDSLSLYLLKRLIQNKRNPTECRVSCLETHSDPWHSFFQENGAQLPSLKCKLDDLSESLLTEHGKQKFPDFRGCHKKRQRPSTWRSFSQITLWRGSQSLRHPWQRPSDKARWPPTHSHAREWATSGRSLQRADHIQAKTTRQATP